MNRAILIIIIIIFSEGSLSDEITIDKNGNYYLLKNDGTYKKLPEPKPGYKYVIKKEKIEKEKKSFFKYPEKKSRKRTDSGIR